MSSSSSAEADDDDDKLYNHHNTRQSSLMHITFKTFTRKYVLQFGVLVSLIVMPSPWSDLITSKYCQFRVDQMAIS